MVTVANQNRDPATVGAVPGQEVIKMSAPPYSTTSPATLAHSFATMLDVGKACLENIIPVILLRKGTNQPVVEGPINPETGRPSVIIYDDADIFEAALKAHPGANVAQRLYPESHLLLVDHDSKTNMPDELKTIVLPEHRTWRTSTPHGFHVFYYYSGNESLKRVQKPYGLPFDLLCNGYAPLPPSTRTDGSYKWIPGHSIYDISVGALEEAPAALIEFWLKAMEYKPKSTPATTPDGDRTSAFTLLESLIPEHQRNTSLLKIACRLRRCGATADQIYVFLNGLNHTIVMPPLPQHEIQSIASSSCRYNPAAQRGPVEPLQPVEEV